MKAVSIMQSPISLAPTGSAVEAGAVRGRSSFAEMVTSGCVAEWAGDVLQLTDTETVGSAQTDGLEVSLAAMETVSSDALMGTGTVIDLNSIPALLAGLPLALAAELISPLTKPEHGPLRPEDAADFLACPLSARQLPSLSERAENADDGNPDFADRQASEPVITSFETVINPFVTNAGIMRADSVATNGARIPNTGIEYRELNMASDVQWCQDLAKEIIASAEREDRISFRLAPRELGQMDVNLSTSDEGLTVKIMTETEDARLLMAAQQQNLLDDLHGNGIRIAGAEISTGDRRHQGNRPRQRSPFNDAAPDDSGTKEKQPHMRPQGRFA
jgi:Flagellar hook-length control protein FliK